VICGAETLKKTSKSKERRTKYNPEAYREFAVTVYELSLIGHMARKEPGQRDRIPQSKNARNDQRHLRVQGLAACRRDNDS
jgi:hypothetical protein